MIYFYDGSEDAFLTAFVAAYGDEDARLTSTNCQLSLGQQTVFVVADPVRAARARNRLASFDKRFPYDLNRLMRSGDASKDAVAFAYFKLLAQKRRPVRGMLAENAVLDAEQLLRKISVEIDHMYGFLRFTESASGALYAPIAPDNDICDLLLPHFKARLPNFPFVIHDVKRKKAAIYDGENVFFAPLERAEILLSADETAWQTLWKNYFSAVNIPSRERLKQQRAHLPVRYRALMTEFQDILSSAT